MLLAIDQSVFEKCIQDQHEVCQIFFLDGFQFLKASQQFFSSVSQRFQLERAATVLFFFLYLARPRIPACFLTWRRLLILSSKWVNFLSNSHFEICKLFDAALICIDDLKTVLDIIKEHLLSRVSHARLLANFGFNIFIWIFFEEFCEFLLNVLHVLLRIGVGLIFVGRVRIGASTGIGICFQSSLHLGSWPGHLLVILARSAARKYLRRQLLGRGYHEAIVAGRLVLSVCLRSTACLHICLILKNIVTNIQKIVLTSEDKADGSRSCFNLRVWDFGEPTEPMEPCKFLSSSYSRTSSWLYSELDLIT